MAGKKGKGCDEPAQDAPDVLETASKRSKPIPWAANKGALNWKLIDAIGEDGNCRVICGKGKDEVSNCYFFLSCSNW